MLKRIRHMASGRSFYIKLVTYFLLLSMLPLLLIGIFSYISTREAMERQLNDSNLRFLKQTANTVEIIIRQISDSCKQLALDNTFKEFENYYRSDYYENLISSLQTSEDLIGSARYIDVKAKVYERINILKLSNEFIDSVYFYDNQKKKVFTSVGTQYETRLFFDQDWYGFTAKEFLSPYIMDTRRARQMDGTEKDVITFVFRSFNYPENLLAVNLDAQSFYDNIATRLDLKKDSKFFILSASGTPILYDRKDSFYSSAVRQLSLEADYSRGDGFAIREIDQSQYLFSGLAAESTGWRYVSANALRSYYEGMNGILALIAAVALVLVFLVLVVALMSLRSLYRPIRTILQMLGEKPAGNRNSGNQKLGELDVIRTTLSEVLDEREVMEEKLEKSLPAYREKFILSLLKGHSYSREEIRERLHFLEIPLELTGLAVMTTALDDLRELKGKMELYSVQKLRLLEICEEALPFPNRVLCETEEGKITAILNLEPEEFHRLFFAAKQLKEAIKEKLGLSCTIGVGDYCPSVDDLERAFGEAEEALKHRLIIGSGEVIYIGDLRLRTGGNHTFPREKQANLHHYIRNGDKENAHRLFLEILKDIVLQDERMDYYQAQQLYIRLLDGVVETLLSLGLDLKVVYGQHTNLYAELAAIDNFGNIIRWFEKLFEVAANHVRSAVAEKSNRHVDEIGKLLELDCGRNVSLEYLAEKLHLNPAYLSRIFKEATGKNFMEYLTAFRIEKSKVLLTESDMKVKELCEHMGYTNANYFIKLFKEHTGVTPGEYRQLYTGDVKTR